MNLKQAYLRASVETGQQFEACLTETGPQLIYLDCGFFDAGQFRALADRAHAAGRLIGLRLPYIWRDRAEAWLAACAGEIRAAGFDLFLYRNIESALAFAEAGLYGLAGALADSSMYVLNRDAALFLREMLPGPAGITFSLEQDRREIGELARALKGAFPGETGSSQQTIESKPGASGEVPVELPVYGRAPMMVSAQCLNKTASGCDKKEKLLYLKDRTGNRMPVKNCCRFCYNLIYNAVPTVLYDLEEEIRAVGPDSVRYAFSAESADEVRRILAGELPAGGFTRGHWKKSVQ